MNTILDFFSAGQMITKGAHEFAGPCPACGGRDRFLVWTNRPRGGAFLCRHCEAQGDGIQFLRTFHSLSYPEACKALGLSAKAGSSDRPSFARQEKQAASASGAPSTLGPTPLPAPVPASLPSALWMERAAAFLISCQRNIRAPAALAMLAAVASALKAP